MRLTLILATLGILVLIVARQILDTPDTSTPPAQESASRDLADADETGDHQASARAPARVDALGSSRRSIRAIDTSGMPLPGVAIHAVPNTRRVRVGDASLLGRSNDDGKVMLAPADHHRWFIARRAGFTTAGGIVSDKEEQTTVVLHPILGKTTFVCANHERPVAGIRILVSKVDVAEPSDPAAGDADTMPGWNAATAIYELETGPDGRAELTEAPPGEYLVRYEGRGLVPLAEDGRHRSIQHPQGLLDVPLGQLVGAWIEIQGDSVISCTASLDAPSGVIAQNMETFAAQSLQSAEWNEVRPGSVHTVAVSARGSIPATMTLELAERGSLSIERILIPVTEVKEPETIDVRSRPIENSPVSATFRFTSPSGSELRFSGAFSSVKVVAEEDWKAGLPKGAVIRPERQLPLRPGRYYLFSHDAAIREALPREPVDLTSMSGEQTIDIALQKELVPLRIALETESGEPPGFTKFAFFRDGQLVERTNRRGESAILKAVTPGEYRITVDVHGYGEASQSVTLKPGDRSAEVVFALQPDGSR